MKTLIIGWFWMLGLLGTNLAVAEDHDSVTLPRAQFWATTTLMQALKERKYTREFGKEKIVSPDAFQSTLGRIRRELP